VKIETKVVLAVSQSETFDRKKPKQVSPVKKEFSPVKPQVSLKRNRSESADEVLPLVVKRAKRTVEDTIVKESDESNHD